MQQARWIVQQELQFGMDALIDRGQRLTVSERGVVIVLKGSPLLFTHGAQRLPVHRAVVDLDERLFHHRRNVRNRQRGGRSRALQWRGPHLAHVGEERTQRDRLAFAQFGERGIAASDEEPLSVGRRLAVTDEDDHGSKSRPHSDRA